MPDSFGLFVDQELDKVARSLESHREVIEEGGSGDPWTYVKLPATVATTATASLDTDLAFTPVPDSHYLFEACLFLQAAAATTGARPGIKWPSGTVQEAAWAIAPSGETTFNSRFWGAPTPNFAASDGVPVANEGVFGKVEGQFLTGPSPSGQLVITIASEVAGSEARIMANSWLRYRTI